MRIPKGRVVALSKKEPTVKPRLSISSCWSQLGHWRSATCVALVVFSAERSRRGQHSRAWEGAAQLGGLRSTPASPCSLEPSNVGRCGALCKQEDHTHPRPKRQHHTSVGYAATTLKPSLVGG